MKRVENLHLIGNMGHVDKIGLIRVKALEHAARHFGIECTHADLPRSEVIKQGAGDRGLTDSAFISADEYDCRLFHDGLPESNDTSAAHTPLVERNHGRTEAITWIRIATRSESAVEASSRLGLLPLRLMGTTFVDAHHR